MTEHTTVKDYNYISLEPEYENTYETYMKMHLKWKQKNITLTLIWSVWLACYRELPPGLVLTSPRQWHQICQTVHCRTVWCCDKGQGHWWSCLATQALKEWPVAECETDLQWLHLGVTYKKRQNKNKTFFKWNYWQFSLSFFYVYEDFLPILWFSKLSNTKSPVFFLGKFWYSLYVFAIYT